MPGPCVWTPTPWRSLVQGDFRVVGQAARCRPQTQSVFPNFPCHHFCALRYFSFVFLFLFLPFFWTSAGKHFCALKCFFRFVFCCVFVSFFWNPDVKMKKQLYLCLYPLAHLHKVNIFEKVAAYYSWPLIEATRSVKTKLRTHNTFVLTPSWRSSKAACWESCRAVPFCVA